ncbi:MAG TPA: isoaspartyl peptidase/L-asparaginase, partial [Anaerolineae bacterium]|nr:isoaspartyl peptidase/L-asparaginase [Anaerolineae bacterium]
MILVGSSNAAIGFGEGMRILREGGDAIDAVEAVIRLVESNPEDHSVGYSGLPNVLGEVELDASIMDGRTLAAGA